MRLIDADALIKELEAMANNEWNVQVGSSKGLEDAIDVIDNAPTVDLLVARMTDGVIIPITRPQGEWKLHGMIYYCSVCGHDCEQGGNDCCSNEKSLHEGDNVSDVLVCGKWEVNKNDS